MRSIFGWQIYQRSLSLLQVRQGNRRLVWWLSEDLRVLWANWPSVLFMQKKCRDEKLSSFLLRLRETLALNWGVHFPKRRQWMDLKCHLYYQLLVERRTKTKVHYKRPKMGCDSSCWGLWVQMLLCMVWCSYWIHLNNCQLYWELERMVEQSREC